MKEERGASTKSWPPTTAGKEKREAAVGRNFEFPFNRGKAARTKAGKGVG